MCFEMGDNNLFQQKCTIQENLLNTRKKQVLISSLETCSDDLCYDIGPSPSQSCQEELANLATIHSEIPELIADMLDLNDSLRLNAKEKLAVYSPYIL